MGSENGDPAAGLVVVWDDCGGGELGGVEGVARRPGGGGGEVVEFNCVVVGCCCDLAAGWC